MLIMSRSSSMGSITGRKKILSEVEAGSQMNVKEAGEKMKGRSKNLFGTWRDIYSFDLTPLRSRLQPTARILERKKKESAQ